ncbi:MAG: Fur family transcriptional regulator [Desulfobacteraceae bacterium]|nr:Fur family transcriptional regulator [Desulfobacteraceae bacterium]
MSNRHEQEKKQFKRLFQQQGVDRFDDRFQVLEAFLKLEHHVTRKDVSRQLKEDGIHLPDGFVTDSMEHLCRFGFASRVDFDSGEDVFYEHLHLGVHHDHMVCVKCSAILEFKDEALEILQKKMADAHGFYMLQHKMEIYGLCSQCMANRKTQVPLHKAKPGEKLIVKELAAGKNMQLRISSMGLKIGDPIEVVSNGFGGQVVIAAGENRLVIGSGMAQKIWVQSVDRGPALGIHDAGGIKETSHEAFMSLSQMKAGQEATIVRVSGENQLRRRLLEMGINRGAIIYVEKYAPLKDPLELVVKGYHLSLRVEEAADILVENVKTKKR